MCWSVCHDTWDLFRILCNEFVSPPVYGWNTTQLVAQERAEPYEVKFFVRKGVRELFRARLIYQPELVPGNASKDIVDRYWVAWGGGGGGRDLQL